MFSSPLFLCVLSVLAVRYSLTSTANSYTLKRHTAPVFSVAISPDAQTLISSSTDGIINIWNLHTRELLQTLSGCSPVGKTLVSGGKGGIIKIWRQMLGTDEPIHELISSGE